MKLVACCCTGSVVWLAAVLLLLSAALVSGSANDGDDSLFLRRKLEGEDLSPPAFDDDKEEESNEHKVCPVHDPTATTEEGGGNSIFDPPTAGEMQQVMEAMMLYDFSNEADDDNITLTLQPLPLPDVMAIGQLFYGQSLATTAIPSPGPIWGGIQTNYIARMELIPPIKQEATAFLFGNDDAPMPGRYARVNVNFGALAQPKFVEYKVGPLSADSNEMIVEKLSEHIWNTRPREINEAWCLKLMVHMILTEEDFQIITSESFANKTHLFNGLSDHEGAPPGLLPEERYTQVRVMMDVHGTWDGKKLNPVPLVFTINNTDVDPGMWTADKFWYNRQGPYTRDELVDAYMTDELDKIVIPEEHFQEIQQSSFPQKRPGKDRPMADKPGPQLYMPEGARYTIDGRTVNWMGWSFHAGYDFRAGPNFKNIMFQGERIAYEVALNEIGLLYTSNDPAVGNLNYLDSNFGNGKYRELMRGVDCPDYATYLTNYWFQALRGPVTAHGAVCVFEVATGDVLWRRAGPFVSGLPNTELHVRFAMPNGNYDYIVTYKFKLDGELHVEVASSGYIQTYYMPQEWNEKDPFSYRLQTYSGGSLHDHTFGFKVDLDVVSETNSFETVSYKTGSTLDAVNSGNPDPPLTEKPEYLLFDTMRWVEYNTVQTEDDAIMNKDPFAPKEWIFGDSTKKNKWGNTRAYRLVLGSTPSSLYPLGSQTMPAFSYAKQMLAVTQYKDNEQTCSGAYDMNRLADPLGSFENFVDGESIVQEDLVAWVSLAFLHLPISENMPMTNAVKTGFTIAPWNFFDENPAMDLPHYLRMNEAEIPGDNRREDLPVVEQCIPASFPTEHTFSGA
ncbi:sensitive amine oxidase [Seminavis robusta]|uniref:Amine oxidase n=1 Tax=Seminavis robusta TaxID=568900 RepID=A0A9N8H6N7_9STRA|nr:sensitive amine oxidase [Seminavis robusta]|eukprot:Sro176_g077530.1 sensitive amine oxidase (844) ;mRNA; r:83449-86205